ncbi:MAG: phosphate signaling complex protein PhoU [Oscillospiraceae bacterium]|nr:phosphate signaling complex protein PhoU [Oscillospiraceae bacterium]
MRSNFDKQLDMLNVQLTEMSIFIESAIDCAADALVHSDRKKAQMAISFDSEADSMEKDIEKLCIKLLLLQQPVAKDLRQVSAALKMITDMERIGDQARDISELILGSEQDFCIKPDGIIAQMADATIKMVHEVVVSFVEKDIEKAQQVIAFDDVIDDLYSRAKLEIVGRIKAEKEDADILVNLLSIAKYFERIGDHTTNIAEWVVFSITGVHKKENMMYTE